MAKAACAGLDSDIFFPQQGGTSKPAKDICDDCPVKIPCLEYAVFWAERFGIWGSLSERERRGLRLRLGLPDYPDDDDDQ